jgi:hypothetical protein
MVEIYQGNMIAPGYNNISNMVNIESLLISGRRFPTVDDLGKFSDGIGQIRGDYVEQPQGVNTTEWFFSGAMSLEQYEWAYYTLLGGNRSGEVTFRTQRYTPGFYITANAVLNIGNSPTKQKILGFFRPDKWVFTALAILEEDLMYGSIYTKDGSTAQSGITTTPVLFTGFAADGLSSGTTPAHGSDNITVSYSRKYNVRFWAQFGSLTASTQYKFNVRVNAVEQVIQCEFTSNATPDGEQVSMSGDLSLTANDIVTVYVETDGTGALTLLNGALEVTSKSTS